MNQKQKSVYAHETAGRLMTSNVPIVALSVKIGDIEQLLLKRAKEFETINYVYVVDEGGRFLGAISIKDIFALPKSTPVTGLLPKNLISVRPHTDQERVALLALKHKLKAIPVVDKENHLLGIVSSDTILNILHNENIEDVLRFAGMGKLNDPAVSIISASAGMHFRKRLPWLVVGLLGGVAAAFIVGFFEEALRAHIILAMFIPAVVYMADAVGAQTQTIFIRSLALDRTLNLRAYVWREIRVNVFLAVILGVMIAMFSLFWWNSGAIGAILGISIFITILAAMAIALFLPWFLGLLKFDPAIASGPFATVVRDISSLVIYFAVASFFI